MSNEHLNPNRGWTLIRTGGQFSPDEIDHLKECNQCTDWLSLFADLARGAGFKPEFQLPFFFVAEDQHLTAGRAWGLIRDKGQFSPPELGHLHCCKVCNDWLSRFALAARNAGFDIKFMIPPCDFPRE